MPTGIPKTELEKEADAIRQRIQRDLERLHAIIAETSEAQRRLEKIRSAFGTPNGVPG